VGFFLPPILLKVDRTEAKKKDRYGGLIITRIIDFREEDMGKGERGELLSFSFLRTGRGRGREAAVFPICVHLKKKEGREERGRGRLSFLCVTERGEIPAS